MIRKGMSLLQSQTIRYILAGGLTTALNIILFSVLHYFSVDYRLSNTVAFVLATLFAYFINEGFVFKVKRASHQVRWKRGASFFLLRIVSYVVDMGLMIVLISVLSFDAFLSKIGVNIVIILLNYIISKYHIFKGVTPQSTE